MRKLTTLLILALLALAALPALAGAASSSDAPALAARSPYGAIVVANRASGTISVIDALSETVTGTYALPAGDKAPEPMYVVYSRSGDRVFVGDRANNRVVVFRAQDYSVEATVPTGAGVFHMWADPQDTQLWVNNDVDNTSTVIDPATLEVIATVPMPADLIAQGFKPHDVVLDTSYAYVTLLGGAGDSDYVIKFSKATFKELARALVGKDPHVSLTLLNDLLYVPSQNSSVVNVLDRSTLAKVKDIPVPGAHGAAMAFEGQRFYTTNLPGSGSGGLVAIDTTSNSVVGQAVDTPYPVPHNIASNLRTNKLFVTHSGGSSDKVTIYRASRRSPVPIYAGEVTVGLNPFGIAYVPGM
jgi:YVTN family beta-propeller protein